MNRNQFLWLAVFILMSWKAVAQDSHPAIIVEATGAITTVNDKGKKENVISGMSMFPPAKVSMAAGSKMVFLENDRFKIFEGLNDILLKKPDEDQRIAVKNFDPTFAEYLKAALSAVNTGIARKFIKLKSNNLGSGWGVQDPKSKGGWGVQDPKSKGGWGVQDPKSKGGWGVKDPGGNSGWGVSDPKKTGGWGVQDPKKSGGWGVQDPKSKGGWGTKDGKSNSGWGVKDMSILVTTPGGVYGPKPMQLNWLAEKGVNEYLVCIFDENLEIVQQKFSNVTYTVMDFSKLNAEKSYYWQVFAGNKQAISPAVTFSVLSQEDYDFNLNASGDSNIYKRVNETTRGLMNAVAFENNRMYADAQNTYESLTKADPGNKLVRLCHMAFSLRMGQENLAKDISKGL